MNNQLRTHSSSTQTAANVSARATPEIMQAAAFAGIFGVSLLTILAGTVPAALGSERGRRGVIAVAVFTVALPALVWAGGALRLDAAPDYGSDDAAAMVAGVRLRIVQANIPQQQKWKPKELG